MKLVLFVLFSILCNVYANLKCYDCDPRSAGNCVDPSNTNAPTTVCNSNDENEYSSSDPPLEFACYTLLATGDNSGTYRGCIDGTSETACEKLKTKVPDLDSCKACSGDNCNYEDFSTEKDDSDNGGNGVADTAASIGILSVGVIFAIRGIF